MTKLHAFILLAVLAVLAFLALSGLLLYSLCVVSGRASRQAEAMASRFVKDTQPNEDTL